MSKEILKEEEVVAFQLRSLYKKYGYLPYKMSKFEEYDLYAKNKDFLGNSRIITFNDTDGKLLALKPDITLSIIKNDGDGGAKRKVYYHESIYRASKRTGGFRELQQSGIECIGDIDGYDVFETVYLAAASLAAISKDFILDLSHLGIVTSILKAACADKGFENEAKECLAEKNAHGLIALCEEYGVSAEHKARAVALVGAYGKPDEVLERLKGICTDEEGKALSDLELLCSLLKKTEYAENIRLDFSVVNNGKYYDDILFKGFVHGVGEGVLSGGRYDKLLARMGRKSGGIGFAVDLDLLEGLVKRPSEYDVDVLVLYDDHTSVAAVAETVRLIAADGSCVSAQKSTGGLRYKRLVDLRGE